MSTSAEQAEASPTEELRPEEKATDNEAAEAAKMEEEEEEEDNGAASTGETRDTTTGKPTSPQSPEQSRDERPTGTDSAAAENEHKDEKGGAMDKELEKEREMFNSLFSTRRPKDGWAGLGSGLKSMAKGGAAGIASLVAQPIVGAKNGGVGGFFTGLATGVASCVALPVTGVCVGAVQIGRGVFNSAEAVSSAGKGMVWNDDTREWFYYRLDDDAEEVKKTEEQRKKDGQDLSSGAGPNRKVKDDTYYKLLGVPTNANQSQIKKAYYKSARLCHPDKNRDPSARGKFQELGHAYQVLANDQSRAAYDRDGLNESNERISPQSIDPLLFFAILFGSDNVAPYIGELWLASKAETLLKDSKMAQDLMKDGTESEDIDKQSKRQEHVKQLLEEDEFAQRKRQVQCAINIRQRIQPFVESEEGMDESEFVVAVQAEAAKICQSSFGYIFCTAIGRTLELEATEFLGFSRSAFGSWDAHSANLSKNVANMSNNIKVINAGISAIRAGSQAMKQVESMQKQKMEESKDGNPVPPLDSSNAKETMEKLEDTLPALLELAWAFNVRDISRTLKKVCQKLFYDASVEREVRWKRAEAVQIFGREFYAIGKASETTKNLNQNPENKDEIKFRAEIAAMTTLAKAQGQEITEAEAEFLIRQQRLQKSNGTTSSTPNPNANTPPA